jgi:phosphocarrier protein HPr
MTRLRLVLKTINDVKEFVRIVNNFDYEIDLTSGRYVVDAKSIMGIFSLDLTRPLDVEVRSDHCEDLQAELGRFLV